MRTFDANFSAQLASQSPKLRTTLDIIQLSGPARRLSSESFSLLELPSVTAYTYVGELLEIGGIYDRLEGASDVRISVADTAANRAAMTLGLEVEIRLLAITAVLGEGDYIGYRELFFRGMLSDPITIAGGRIQCDAVSNDVAKHSKQIGNLLTADEYPDVHPDYIGEMIPIVVGYVPRCKLLPSDIGTVGELAVAVDAAATTFTLSDASRFLSSGGVVIESETANYTGKSGDSLTGVTRGTGGSTPAAHDAGALISQLVSPNVYLIADHPIKQASAPIIDGVRLQSEYSSTLNGAIDASQTTIVLASASGWSTQGSVVIDSEVINYLGISVNTLTGCERGQNGTAAASHANGASASGRRFYVRTNNGGRAYMYLAMPVSAVDQIAFAELVESDVIGAVDDASGTVTGTANAVIDHPGHVVHWLLRQFGDVSGTEFGDSSWEEMPSYTMAFRIDERQPLIALARDVARQVRAALVYSGGGFQFFARKVSVSAGDVSSPAYTIGDTRIIRDDGGESTVQIGYVGLSDLLNKLTYRAGLRGDGTYTADGTIEDTTSQASYGVRPGILELPGIPDNVDAAVIATWYAERLASTVTRRTISCRCSLPVLLLEPGDWVRVTSSKMGIDTLAEVVASGPKALSRESGSHIALVLEEFSGVDPDWF